MKEMDFFQEGDSSREFNWHDLILSNFTHDGASICRCFIQFGKFPLEQRFNCVSHEKLSGFASTEGDIVHRSTIAQDAFTVEYKYMRGCHGIVLICDHVLRVDQNLWHGTRFCSFCHHLKRFVLIRGNRKQFHFPVPFLKQIQDQTICPGGMRAFRRPKIDNDDFPAIITQFMKAYLQDQAIQNSARVGLICMRRLYRSSYLLEPSEHPCK